MDPVVHDKMAWWHESVRIAGLSWVESNRFPEDSSLKWPTMQGFFFVVVIISWLLNKRASCNMPRSLDFTVIQEQAELKLGEVLHRHQ